jgi:sugar fermentation stimulation protein A
MPVEGTVVERRNRFVVAVHLGGCRVVDAYLANTARLGGLLEPGRRVLVEPADDPARTTRFTLTRIWDGCWVGIEAYRAPGLLAGWMLERRVWEPFGAVAGIDREVRFGRHRIDLVVHLSDGGSVVTEVKSGSRRAGRSAPLSRTPSTRGEAHLEALADLVAGGRPAAAVFVIQRPDVDRMLVGGDADPGWVAAVMRAHAAGVHVLAYRCDVTPEVIAVAGRIPVVFS